MGNAYKQPSVKKYFLKASPKFQSWGKEPNYVNEATGTSIKSNNNYLWWPLGGRPPTEVNGMLVNRMLCVGSIAIIIIQSFIKVFE